MIPRNSNLFKYYDIEQEYYPSLGYEAAIFIGRVNYVQEIHNIYQTWQILKSRTDILVNLSEWIEDFYLFLNYNYKKGINLKG